MTRTRQDAVSDPILLIKLIWYVPVSVARTADLLVKTVLSGNVSNLILELGKISSPFIIQTGFGVGFPVNGTVMVNSSPAITVMSRMLRSLVILGTPRTTSNSHISVEL